MLVGIAAVSALAILGLWYGWSRSRNLEVRFRKLSGQLGQISHGQNTAAAHALLRQVHTLILAALQDGNSRLAYQAIDLLKIAFSDEIWRRDEARQLTAIVTGAARATQPETAAAALDAFRQLLRKLPAETVPDALDQLNYIAAMAIKEKYPFLATKAVEIILTVLEKDWEKNSAATVTALRVLKTAGALALKRRDSGLFREIVARLEAATPPVINAEQASALVSLTGVWLHRMMRNDDPTLFSLLTDYIGQLTNRGTLSEAGRAELIREWQNLAGTASLKPGSQLAPLIIDFALRLALGSYSEELWGEAVAGAGQTFRLAFGRFEVAQAMPNLLPLLEIGRELLIQELKFGSQQEETFRRRALFVTVRECVAVADYAARQDMVSTAGDRIADFYRWWAAQPNRTGSKTAKRFCQLLAAYWLRTRTKQAKRAQLSEELTEPPLLSDDDKMRLGFLL